MKHKRVGIDLDGVIVDFTTKFASILREIGVQLVADQPQDWGWLSLGVTSKDMDRAWNIVSNTENFWETLAPTEDIFAMSEFFHKHAGIDFDIYFITARRDVKGRSAKTQSERWLYDHLGEPDSPITVLPVKGGLDKAEVIYSLRLDYSIDDHTPTICNNKTIANHKAYLLDKPWNQDGKSYNLNIVKTLREFFDIIEKG